MLYVDRLKEMREIARARAQEDFGFFANSVLGAKLDEEFCEGVQRRVERREHVVLNGHQHVLSAWLSVIGRAEKLACAPTETFTWLFGDRVQRAA